MAIRSAVEQITPAIADKILTASRDQVKNRNVMDGHVEWLAAQMKAGKWRTNGEPIILDDEDLLLDGQHRLYAVISAETTIDTLVTRGVDRSTFATIDTGMARTAGNVLAIAGEGNSPILAAALGWLHRYEMGKMLAGVKSAGFTSMMGLAILKKHPGMRESATWANGVRSNVFLAHVPPSALAFLHYIFSQHKPQKAQEFFDLIGDIKSDNPGTPTRVMRDWILKNERSRCPATTLEYLAIMVKAWTSFLDGRQPKTYVWYRTAVNPESFPMFPGEKESRGRSVRGMERKDGRVRKPKPKNGR